MTLRTIALSTFGLMLMACGTQMTAPPPSNSGVADGSAEGNADGDVARPPVPTEAPAGAAPRTSQSEESAREKGRGAPADAEPEARPGLATLWGEDRGSAMRFSSFLRATPAQPFTVATLFYNDKDGVQAMARQSGVNDFGDSGRGTSNGFVTVRLLDDDGDPLPGFEAGSRQYVVGEPGARYTVEVENKTGMRIEAVATVDGLDVIDGRPGTMEKRGYLIDPFGKLEIEGFRRSMDTVAAFRFGSVKDSYAAAKGDARNVGLVGIAFFHEQGSNPRWTNEEIRRRHDANPFPGRFAEPVGH